MTEKELIQEERPEIIDEHSRRYWLFNGRVVVYEVKGDSREAIDSWYNIAVSTHKIYPQNQPYIAIHDVRGARLSPYARAKAAEMTKTLGDKKGDTILLLANDLFGQMIRLFAMTLTFRPQPNMRRHITMSWHEAIAVAERLLAAEQGNA